MSDSKRGAYLIFSIGLVCVGVGLVFGYVAGAAIFFAVAGLLAIIGLVSND